MFNIFKSARAANSIPQPVFSRNSVPIYVWRPKEEGYRNFGDELTPLLAERIAEWHGVTINAVVPTAGKPKLLGVGSILHQAKNGDVVWGSGVNGKNWPRNLAENQELDVRAVRGPLTQNVLAQFGISAPNIFGDPGLLFPELFEAEIAAERKSVSQELGELGTIFIPNLNDERFLPTSHPDVVNISPSETPFRIAQIISSSKLVLSSSLHGIVFADALGVPCRPVLSAFEPTFKYIDYFAGTGRDGLNWASTIQDALGMPDIPKAIWDRHAIIRSFPLDAIA